MATYVFDFTAFEPWTKETITAKLKQYCKKWTFQKEEAPSTKTIHFQGRFSLKEKRGSASACASALEVTWHLSQTSKQNKDNVFYVTKEDSRIEGPWSDKDIEIYIPKQYRKIKDNMYPWQKEIWDSKDNEDFRTVNVLYDPNGCQGKSSIAHLMACTGNAMILPPTNDAKELIQSICDMCMAKETRTPGMVFINFPRAMDQKSVAGIYKAIEQIKDGHLYDTRYHYKEWWIDSPQIWVFCNDLPNYSQLSKDRWKTWTIGEKLSLIART